MRIAFRAPGARSPLTDGKEVEATHGAILAEFRAAAEEAAEDALSRSGLTPVADLTLARLGREKGSQRLDATVEA
jgi:hypothetical protein